MTVIALENYVFEVVISPGTGSFTVGTPVSGRMPWSSYTDGTVTFYVADDGIRVETGIGTYTAGTLTRDTVIWNNAGTAPTKLNFSGSTNVFSDIPAERAVWRDTNGDLTIDSYSLIMTYGVGVGVAGSGSVGGSSTAGLMLAGNGSVSDVTFLNKSLVSSLTLATDTSDWTIAAAGSLTLPTLVTNGAVNVGVAGTGSAGGSTTNGLTLSGNGSSYDLTVLNKSAQTALTLATGTLNWTMYGTLAISSTLAVTGAITGSSTVTATGYKVSTNQVVGARDTGWTAMTGTPDNATAYATSTVTLAQLAGRVMSLQTALTTHGLIGT